jgi:DDE superfamily endonuclease
MTPRGLGRRCLQDLYNWKHRRYTLSNLIGVNAIGRITTAVCGGSGNVSDWEILKLTALYQAMEGEEGADASKRYPEGYCIVADSGFVHRKWIMTPFSERWTSPPPHGSINYLSCRLYNFRLSQIRVVSGNAFSRLKGRFSILRGLPFNPELSSRVVYAACCLNNFTEERSEAVLRSWILALNTEGIDCDHMANRVPTWSPTSQSARTATAEAMAVRIGELKRMGLPWVEEIW